MGNHMPEEIFEVTRERFHLLDRNQYIVQGSWPKDAKMEAYLDGDYETDIEIYLRSQQNMIELADFLTSGLLAR